MKSNPVFNLLSTLLVSIYLLGVCAWLLYTRQIPNPALGKVVRSYFRKPYEAVLSGFEQNGGYCWTSIISIEPLSDLENISALRVFEDGKPLPTPHAPHDDILALGAGRFSHWGPKVYFSTTDNSDPNTNGRQYTVKEIK
jgi:hypothetical protein